MPLGKIRFKSNGTSGGQKGIESIIYHLKNDKFLRLKIGIATTESTNSLASYVLAPFNSQYAQQVTNIVNESVEAIKFLLENDVSKTMNKYN